MSELNELRGEVARLRRAATRKISRVKRNTGAQLSGTEFDPRRSTSAHRQYTAKQLEGYRAALSNFLSRETQFVSDASRAPIPRREFETYKALENQYRATAGSVYERLKNTELPSGETVMERLAKMQPVQRTMHNTAMNPIFDPHNRQPDEIVSRDALRKLTRQLKRDSSPGVIKRKIRQARDQYAQMMDTINMPELLKATKKLSNDQFLALWNLTNFASAVALSYENAKKMLSPKEQSWGYEQVRQQMNDAMELIDWARQI